jgi:hypothetical protein
MFRRRLASRLVAVLATHLIAAFILPLSLGGSAQAVTIDWVTVGGAGNSADDTGYGAVADHHLPPRTAQITLQTFDSSTAQASAHSPIIVDLEVDEQPVLHQIVVIRLKIQSAFDASNTKAAIVLPEGVIKVDGTLEWQGDLEQKKPVELLARVKFVQAGELMISGYAKHIIDEDNSWGDVDYLYLNVTGD